MTFLTDTQGTVRQSWLSTNSRPWHYYSLLAEPFIACLILAYLSKTLPESSQIIVKQIALWTLTARDEGDLISKNIPSRHIKVCKTHHTTELCKTLHDLDRTWNRAGCSLQQLFFHFCGSSGRFNNKQNKEALLRKYPLTLLEAIKTNPNTHRITPYHLSLGEVAANVTFHLAYVMPHLSFNLSLVRW